ncbi:hypothetical protein FO440_12715 [Mucilaginibacter corticis]|uniref:DUF4468 domain-containing protein n=1 Tax=Mucilaginibacter corticis TaxID=2597670 RepID=A0A556ML03_9SPHI|nr:hypothetical protein [Mucilaginibacter corticis]TSJ40606.1 hypothetical protein FO440_12715 [Mucilaginibacter corticis]
MSGMKFLVVFFFFTPITSLAQHIKFDTVKSEYKYDTTYISSFSKKALFLKIKDFTYAHFQSSYDFTTGEVSFSRLTEVNSGLGEAGKIGTTWQLTYDCHIAVKDKMYKVVVEKVRIGKFLYNKELFKSLSDSSNGLADAVKAVDGNIKGLLSDINKIATDIEKK